MDLKWPDFSKQLRKDQILNYCFYDSVPESQLVEAECKIKIVFPDELKAFYRQTDGIGIELVAYPDIGIIDYLILPLEKVLEYSWFLHGDWFAEKNLLFIAPNGNGDYFGYEVVEGRMKSTQIYKWDHEDDSIELYSTSLAMFIQKQIETN
jgi:hypothetical protein